MSIPPHTCITCPVIYSVLGMHGLTAVRLSRSITTGLSFGAGDILDDSGEARMSSVLPDAVRMGFAKRRRESSEARSPSWRWNPGYRGSRRRVLDRRSLRVRRRADHHPGSCPQGILYVVTTEITEDLTRVISVRKAEGYEKDWYYQGRP